MIHIILIAVCFAVMTYSHCCTENPHNTLNEIAEKYLESEGFEDVEDCFHGEPGCNDKAK